jgi:hydrogenase maturation protease
MNTEVVEQIANAVLYEGYMLYPYRPTAIKNRQRFNFGVLYPRAYCELQCGSEASEMKTECLVENTLSSTIEIKIRFLQLAARQGWQEGLEREVCVETCTLESLSERALTRRFAFAGTEDADGRRTESIDGQAELHALQLDQNLYKVSLSVQNLALLENAPATSREQVLLRSLVSVHSILQVADGEFVSLLDPPEPLKGAAATCQNVGTWPVLAGAEGQRDLVLSAPIILYDYPQIAPESAGDLFDGTEIDEILALRILTMTDAEKLEVRNGDDRARRILERTEMLPPEHFQKLHGALRGLRTHSEGVS